MPDTLHRAGSRSRGRHRRTPLAADQAPVLEVAGLSARAGGKVLLDDVSFAVQRGWLVAVVGPTGAGKTSLARALTGGLGCQGSIRLDGVELNGAGADHGRDRIAFVPQDDVLHGQLGLGRTIAYAASLRVAGADAEAERQRRVDAALAELGLQPHADVPVASLSGGQRKRANIAAELVGQPDVIVLDEPTSGLDPGYEKAVMTSLRQLADAGRTVVAVTHSLAALRHCDRVLFLAEGGRVAYYGPPARAASYFGSVDAADVFLALDTEPGQAWKERFRAHPAYARYVRPVVDAASRDTERRPAAAGRDRPGWKRQVGTLLRRQVALLRSDRRHLALLLLQGPLLGLLLWMVLAADSLHLIPGTSTSTPAAETVAMFVALSATWLGASNAVREIVKERHIVRREVDAGLAPSAYVAAKAIVLGTLTMLQTIVLATIACASQHPPAHGAIASGRVEIALVGALVGLAAMALGLLLSAAVMSPDKALALLPMTLVTELALAGGWAATLTTPGLPILRDLTGARWGVVAIGATVAGDGWAWAHAALVLVGLAAGALTLTVVLVHRHTRSAHAHRAAAVRVQRMRVALDERGGALLGAASFALLAIALAVAVRDGGHDGTEQAPRLVAQAPAEAPVAPVLEVPAATVAPETTTSQAPRVRQVRAVEPAPTTTTMAPPDTTTTTVAPTTTTTVYVTPTTAPAAPSGQVTTANSSVPWWWYWWMASNGG